MLTLISFMLLNYYTDVGICLFSFCLTQYTCIAFSNQPWQWSPLPCGCFSTSTKILHKNSASKLHIFFIIIFFFGLSPDPKPLMLRFAVENFGTFRSLFHSFWGGDWFWKKIFLMGLILVQGRSQKFVAHQEVMGWYEMKGWQQPHVRYAWFSQQKHNCLVRS